MSEILELRVAREELVAFCANIFIAIGMEKDAAYNSADILVASDARGIPSHGVARLKRYVDGVKTQVMLPNQKPTEVHRTPTSFVLDAHGGVGLSLSKHVMDEVIVMAQEHGFATASVRDSNHYGIAGYYAMMALPHDMIGFSMTNTAALGIPTFGKHVVFGTNPLAVAVPAYKESPFVLDMSTTVVTRGKIETCLREGTPLPKGWSVDKEGNDTQDAVALLEDMLVQAGGGILPLGGRGELFGGHKGFGLAVLVDILCAVTSGGVFGKSVVDTQKTSARVCHWFAAMKIDLFRDPKAFRLDMDTMLTSIRQSEPAEGHTRVSYAGLKESESEQECAIKGVPLSIPCWKILSSLSEELQVTLPVCTEHEQKETL